jgi:hypothetical protein
MKNNHGICCARSKIAAYFSLFDLAGRKVAPTYTSNNTMNRLTLPPTVPDSCDLSFGSGSTAYVNTNAPKLDVAQLDVYVTELALWWAKNSKIKGTSTRTMAQRLTRAVEDELYASTLHTCDQDFIRGNADWPKLRTWADPHALHDSSPSTIKMRNDTLLAIYRRWATENICDKEIYDGSYDHWLFDVDDIARIAMTKSNGEAKLKTTIRVALRSLRALCEATQEPLLQKKYEDALLPHCLSDDSDEETRKRLTDDQIEQFYAHLDTMHEKAMVAAAASDLKPCIEYLILALHWGDAPGLLQPQRNDMRSFRFHGILCRDDDNYIKFEPATERERDSAKTILVLNTRNKNTCNAAGPFTRLIDLSENKKLCAFLKAYKPFVSKLQDTDTPFLLCSRTGQPMSTSCLSSRCHHIWKTKLEPKLGFNGAGCNVARRAAVDTARRAHGKRKMSEAEIQEEREQCAARGHARGTAEKYY